MPRQSISARPQRLLLSGDEKIQHEFIKKSGPYFASAKYENQGPLFLQRVLNVWFSHWPLHLQDFEDADFMRQRRQSIEKVGTPSMYIPSLILCWLGPCPSFLVGVLHPGPAGIHVAKVLVHL